MTPTKKQNYDHSEKFHKIFGLIPGQASQRGTLVYLGTFSSPYHFLQARYLPLVVSLRSGRLNTPAVLPECRNMDEG